ncbi:uncharacterized protein AMSG_09328 [Thecamonas trahens ATCC 50062]|uniref:Uncharacterized protein n=1 Tax=Thecamonas trahens ATCC 50062 TaxID=461836 RepID=A0A0L0DLX3_THETB|nr:hypothetical protein AMSG_09328 [Thecamonas trahens ATCC 50062]KNC53036.1 hypothetical protein AMSG_09328 [Thecamonas trahens ATCC 50062]|eukprot:XP_013754714.1 hypothetical protein AMSG_09328 [Thecamonas trahens ATCC 50062]
MHGPSPPWATSNDPPPTWRPSLRILPQPQTSTTHHHVGTFGKKQFAAGTGHKVSGTTFRRGRRAFPARSASNPIVPAESRAPAPPPSRSAVSTSYGLRSHPPQAPPRAPDAAAGPRGGRALRARFRTAQAESSHGPPPEWGRGVEHTPGFWKHEGITPLASYRKRIRALPRSARLVLAARKASAARSSQRSMPFTDRVAIRQRDEAVQAVRALDAWSPSRMAGASTAAAAFMSGLGAASPDPNPDADADPQPARSGSRSRDAESQASDTSSEASFSEEIIARQAQERLNRRIRRAQARRKRRKRLVVIDTADDDDPGTDMALADATDVVSDLSRKLSIASTPVFQRLLRYG